MTFSLEEKNSLKSQYTTNLVDDFYRPCLREANLYQRVSGYFSTAGLDLYADGLEELQRNNGEVEFIVSKEISEEDYLRIKGGYDLLAELKPLKIAERNERLTTQTQQRLGNLAFMIANGRARIKIALTNHGIFHDKFGIITSGNEHVFFNGSVNETHGGIGANYESISVDVSWDKSEKVQSRIQANQERFIRLWNDCEPDVKVVEASDVAYEQIAKYQTQASIMDKGVKSDDTEDTVNDNQISFRLLDNTVVRIDKSEERLTNTDRKLKEGSDIARLFEDDNQTIKSTATYKDLERVIKVTTKRASRRKIHVSVSQAVNEFISRNKYSINQYKIMGGVYKDKPDNFPEIKKIEFKEFSKIVQSEVSRPLKNLHLRAAYYEYEMERAANFSVPGAGKTAMLLGVFAYLNSAYAPANEKMKRILVVSPISAFDSWKREFKAVFGNKKALHSIDVQSSSDFEYQLRLDWGVCNLVMINYESLPRYTDLIKRLLDNQTLLVFDEVHRIKNPNGQRAKAALEISPIPKFRYVLTGTPIPNTYTDIYNFLHILYGNEYNSFFGWNPKELVKPSIREIENINESIRPFFWRTNKTDLNVPPADADNLITVKASSQQSKLAEAIYANESSSLAILIRLIQASTNPGLLESAINYDEMMSYDEDGDVKAISKDDFNDLLNLDANPDNHRAYKDMNASGIGSPKFSRGIDLVCRLASEGKKVMVWGIFVNTLDKIADTLRQKGVQVNLVYGATDKSERVRLINDFRDGDAQVLVSNPQTLGESISLHQTVHDAVYFEYDFNLTFMLQSRDRIHRLGLKPGQHTRYYYLQTLDEEAWSDTPGFIDQKIYSRLKDKENTMYAAIDDDTLAIEYSQSEILEAIAIIDEERKRIVKTHE